MYGASAEAAGRELERHGLAFAFKTSWMIEYRLPSDLAQPIRELICARHASGVAGTRPARRVAAPLQTAHDAASLSAYMARTPVRVKADGEIYARFWPKLAGALPPIGSLDDEGFDRMRIGLALDFLREGGFLRLRTGDLPGRDPRRELVPAGDLGAALAAPGEELRERLLDCARELPQARLGMTLARSLAGRTVALGSFGRQCAELADEAGVAHRIGAVEDRAALGAETRRELERGLALTTLGPAWLAGAIELGLDPNGEPTAAVLSPPAIEPADGSLGVCQGNFEIVLMRPPSAAERRELLACCEPVDGQEHVLRLTRAAVRVAAADPERAEPVEQTLRRLCGELPQNVERSVADWARGVQPPLRLRSAIFVDAGSAETAERLLDGPLAGLAQERLGERMIAVPADSLKAVESAVAAAELELEPGLDRISGAWSDRPQLRAGIEAYWMPAGGDNCAGDETAEQAAPPAGRLLSTLGDEPEPAQPARSAPEPESDEPLDEVLSALDEECDVEITYAGARGITVRRVTPIEIDDARLHGWCHLRKDERAFWLNSILAAERVA